MNIKDIDKKFIGNTFRYYNVIIKRGISSTLIDINNKKYIDFLSGISVNQLGYNNKKINNAIKEKIKKYIHLSNLFYDKDRAYLAKEIVENTFKGKLFFVNSGAEANEVAIKIARKWGILYKNKAYKIISMKNSFHGRTITTLTATGQKKFHKYLYPLAKGFSYAEFNNIKSVLKKITKDTVAILVEPVQAEGGIYPAKKEFLKELKRICNKEKILLIFDEVQTGIGRTGYLFAYKKYGVIPDILTMGKGLGGGLPLSAVLVKENISKVYTYGDHGTTLGGNPVACASARVVLKTVNKKQFLDEVIKKGEFIKNEIKKINSNLIKDIRGEGLLIGVDIDYNREKIIKTALEKGLILGSAGEKTIRIAPPLNIKYSELKKGLDIFKQIIGGL